MIIEHREGGEQLQQLSPDRAMEIIFDQIRELQETGEQIQRDSIDKTIVQDITLSRENKVVYKSCTKQDNGY